MSSSKLLAPLVRTCLYHPAPLAAATHAASQPRRRLSSSPGAGISPVYVAGPSSEQHGHSWWRWGAVCAGALVCVSSVGLARYWREREGGLLPCVHAGGGGDGKSGGEAKPPNVSQRELRYQDFASFMFEGEPYMSAHDFLDAVTKDTPRPFHPEVLDGKLVSGMLKKTPFRSKGSIHLFRDMWEGGILSYGDYLFLLTALTKTRRHFEVAFRMIDVDGSDFIDFKEFRLMQEAVTRQRDNALIEQQQLGTSSLSVYLFGQKGNQKLYSKDFFKFIEDLQMEVREIEFNKYSGGAPTICEEDFARILLRHTTWDLEPVFERLDTHLKHKKGLTFSQFTDFCQLLNSLDDFTIAMTMYTIAGRPVTQEEFARAALVCIGKPLDCSVVETVFQIFDVDGDGRLSHREFISIMKNWKLRGSKMREQIGQGMYAQFRTCVKMEMKTK